MSFQCWLLRQQRPTQSWSHWTWNRQLAAAAESLHVFGVRYAAAAAESCSKSRFGTAKNPQSLLAQKLVVVCLKHESSSAAAGLIVKLAEALKGAKNRTASKPRQNECFRLSRANSFYSRSGMRLLLAFPNFWQQKWKKCNLWKISRVNRKPVMQLFVVAEEEDQQLYKLEGQIGFDRSDRAERFYPAPPKSCHLIRFLIWRFRTEEDFSWFSANFFTCFCSGLLNFQREKISLGFLQTLFPTELFASKIRCIEQIIARINFQEANLS